ncbi:acyltransferase domain-containing protein, partial [Halomonas sp. SIMBA_159]
LYTQPCLYVIESILIDLLIDEAGYLPQYVAGHSLGEYSALYAARVFSFEAGLRLVQQRAKLMDTAAGGKMVALMKIDRAQ